jgi:short-subunit dehydrogenase
MATSLNKALAVVTGASSGIGYELAGNLRKMTLTF